MTSDPTPATDSTSPDTPSPTSSPSREPSSDPSPESEMPERSKTWYMALEPQIATAVIQPILRDILSRGVESKADLADKFAEVIGTGSVSSAALDRWLAYCKLDSLFDQPRLYRLPPQTPQQPANPYAHQDNQLYLPGLEPDPQTPDPYDEDGFDDPNQPNPLAQQRQEAAASDSSASHLPPQLQRALASHGLGAGLDGPGSGPGGPSPSPSRPRLRL